MASQKEIGDLLINLTSNVTKATTGIDKAIKRIDNLGVSITNLSNNLEKSANEIAANLNTITSKLSNLNVNQEGFKGLMKTLRSFSNWVVKVSGTDMELFKTQMEKMVPAIKPFINTLKENEEVLIAFSNSLDFSKVIGQYDKTIAQVKLLNEKTRTQEKKTKNVALRNAQINQKLQKTNEQMDSLNKKTSLWSNLWKIGKMAFFLRVLGRMASKVAEIVNLSTSYDESLNKYRSAMKIVTATMEDGSKVTIDYYKKGIQFADKLAESFGLAKKTILDYQSTFMNMLNSLQGLSTAQSYALSESLTTMALDYSSLFNTSIESAMQAFQSVLAGKTMSIRTVSGIDVTDNTLYEYYRQLGGTKTLNSLSQLEKRLLRIYAVNEQMKSANALGDYAETIDSLQNQFRILSEQMKEIKVWLGNIFNRLLKNIVPYIVGGTLALKELLKTLAYAFGYVEGEPKDTLISGIEEDANNAIDAVEELNGLLSFDKFEVLQTGASSKNDLVDSKITEALKNMDSILGQVSYKAQQIRDNILNFLGLGGSTTIGSETVRTLKEGASWLEAIEVALSSIMTLGIYAFLTKIISAIYKAVTAIVLASNAVNSLWVKISSISKMGIFLGIGMIITGLQNGNKALIACGSALLVIASTLKLFSLVKTSKFIQEAIGGILYLTTKLGVLNSTLISTTIGLGLVAGAITVFAFMDKWSAKTKILVGVLGTLASTLLAAASAWLAYHGAMSVGTAVPIILGSITMGVATMTSLVKGIKEYAKGGFPDEGQLFIANEKGPEMVGSIDGKSAVANNQMITKAIEEASYRGMARALNTSDGNNVTLNFGGVDGNAVARALFTPLIEEARRRGYEVNKA